MSSHQRIALIQHYADREGMSYEEARVLLVEEAEGHDNAQEFLDEIGFEDGVEAGHGATRSGGVSENSAMLPHRTEPVIERRASLRGSSSAT